MFWHFTVQINCSCDLKNFANSLPSLEQFLHRSSEQFLKHASKFFFLIFCSKYYNLTSLLAYFKNSNCDAKLVRKKFDYILITLDKIYKFKLMNNLIFKLHEDQKPNWKVYFKMTCLIWYPIISTSDIDLKVLERMVTW